jgi:adenylate cyclase
VTAAPTSGATKPVVDWLVGGARPAQAAPEVLAQMCERLIERGIPVYRVAVFVRTLHPDLLGRRLLWREGKGVEVSEAPIQFTQTEEYRNSPVVVVHGTGVPLRRRLADPACPMDFNMLTDLRSEGVTDYLVSPLNFTNGEVHAITWTTRQPGGFTPEQIAGLEAVVDPLSRLAETYALRRIAGNLLDTYVGHHTGTRILAGQIRRGHSETIRAAIWLSDMRGFTRRADRLPPQMLIDLLNRYFDCQVPAIQRHGGEVLKFMGDGLLAIFPVAGDDADAEEVCGAALAAAREARESVGAMETPEPADDPDQPRFGLALHIGDVLYGNIGGGGRLDFTCIGPAVNLAARLEALAGRLGRTIVASDGFAAHCRPALTRLGEFALPGFAAEQTVYVLDGEAA